MSKIKAALAKIFSDYRIVFWYDVRDELRIEFDNHQVSDVEKVDVDNNDFSIK